MFGRLRVRSLWPVPVVAAAVAAHPGLARAVGVDFWTLPQARAEIAAAADSDRSLADRDDAIMRRITIKEDLIADLLAGRTGLADVAARFLELNEPEPGYLELLRATVPGRSDLERSARNVIGYATARVDDPSASADLHRRLTAELTRLPSAR